MFSKLQSKIVLAQIRGRQLTKQAVDALKPRRGEGFVDTAIKILIGVVIGALIFYALYTLFDNVILPRLGNEIEEMFKSKTK